jgi:hypothetical protein
LTWKLSLLGTVPKKNKKNKIDDLPKSLKPVTPAKLVPAKAGSRSPEFIDFTGFPLSRE